MKLKVTRTIAFLVVLAMIITPASNLATKPVSANAGLPWNRDLKPTGYTPVDKYKAVDATEIVDMTEVSRYIVMFEGASLTTAKGSSAINSVEGQKYLNTLADKRQEILTKAVGLLGREEEIKVRHVYDVILNAVSVELSVEEALKLQSMEGIRKVLKDQDYTYNTDAGPAWIGAGAVWDGTATPDALGTKGEGILVGIIDTGINFDHPSFSDTPADGYTYNWDGDYLGVCAPDGDPDYADACNDKLVGAWSYTGDAPSETVTPEDSDGHGSHTASTVAGNTVTTDFYGSVMTISGVAPHAQIVAYDVCYPTATGGACAGEDSVAAIQQAILDGVDVINYSISGGENPYSDAVELAFLEATNAGVTVSTSAGNSGPTAETVAHRSPWLLSTAATTHNRKFTSFVNFSNTEYRGISTLPGEIPFTADVVNSPVKFGGEDNNPLGCADPGYTDNFYDGAIALVKRGTCTFTEKIQTAAAAGASGVLIFTNTNPPGAMSVSGTTIPGVMLDIPGTMGDAIAAWIAGATDDTVSISAFGADYSDDYADIMANFSSRGPNNTFDVLKPDIAAPGVAILAAVADGVVEPGSEIELNLLQGASMASPHDAGAAALLTALHPDWTPAEIKSALMLTAYDGLLKEDKVTPADPFDIGAGRVQLELAGLTGLVMDETYDNYVAADPAKGGDVRTLNTPSVYNSTCVGECSWTRTFKSVADLPATYIADAPAFVTVTPATFTINSGATQEITITADVSALTPDEWVFGNIEFQTDDSFAGVAGKPISDVAIPLAVLPTTGNLPELARFDAHRDTGMGTMVDLQAVAISSLTVDTYGWVKGVKNEIQLAQDPTPGDPFDDMSQVWYTIVPMDAGAARLVAEITATTAVDLDLFWGFDVNGDGVPQESELYDYSATATAFEYLTEWGFPEDFYDIWIMVQNWEGSGADEDNITLTIGNVPYAPIDPENMTVNGPPTNPAGELFSLDVLWHDIDTEEGDRLYGLIDVYADDAYETEIGVAQLDVVRKADDVVKTADVAEVVAGDTITYTIEITNFANEATDYTITDVLPDEVTYVPDSVTGGAVYDSGTNAITWSGTVDAPGAPYYNVTDSVKDPLCDTGFGGYVDLEQVGIFTQAAITGDTKLWLLTGSTVPYNFYGIDYPAIAFSDDGFAMFDYENNYGGKPWINQDIPDPALPNNVVAMLWQDMEIVYDQATNKGVSLASAGSSVHIIEYDDVQIYGDPTKTYDFEIVYYHVVDDSPGSYEFVFAYDNINGPLDGATIGTENSDGTVATQYAYNNASFTDGHMICFDLVTPNTTHTITFQVTVNEDAAPGPITNTALHTSSQPGTVQEGAVAVVMIPSPVKDLYLPLIFK